jgi:hypothetical protein
MRNGGSVTVFLIKMHYEIHEFALGSRGQPAPRALAM